MKTSSVWLLAATLAAASCAKTSSIGTSGHKTHDTEEPTAAARPKLPSLISATPGTSLGYNQPILGDVDGDGFDDFLVQAATQDPTGLTPGANAVYLFYGKASFAPEIATSQADAIFQSDYAGAWALGDIDADGLADFSIAQTDDAFELVFGNRTRYAGYYAAHSVGTKWAGTPLPPPYATGLQTLIAVRSAGDVNGDGAGDLLVTEYAVGSDVEIEAPLFGLLQTDYLVHGHSGPWDSGVWDAPRLAAASLGIETVRDPEHPAREIRKMLQGLPAGDLDGDGYADLIGAGRDALFVFYGGDQRLEGALDAARADAELRLPPMDEGPTAGLERAYFYGRRVISIGDLDGDGANDLGMFGGPELQITYGAKTRWSGTLELPRDFVIQVSVSNEGMLGAAAAGDVDTDDFPDLALLAALYPTFGGVAEENGGIVSVSYPRATLYLLRGTGTRATGVHRLSGDDVRVVGRQTDPGGIWGPPSVNPIPTEGALLSMAGDIDGDGSCDILAGSTSDPNEPALPPASVVLIPSTPRAPD